MHFNLDFSFLNDPTMKTSYILSIITLSVLLASGHSTYLYGQRSAEFSRDLDYTLTPTVRDTNLPREKQQIDRSVEIPAENIKNMERLYVKVFTEYPREIHFIRAIDREVLLGSKDVTIWEREQQASERQWENERITDGKKGKYRNSARYKLQEGKELTTVTKLGSSLMLGFGPFQKGNYQILIMIKDNKNELYVEERKVSL
jgi:hypothetical protein